MGIFAQALQTALDRCIASKAVCVQNAKVGFLYREAPVFEHDSGWRFFTGEETDEYTDNPDNFVVMSVSEISSRNPDIVALLGESEGGAWEADDEGNFRPVSDWQPQD